MRRGLALRRAIGSATRAAIPMMWIATRRSTDGTLGGRSDLASGEALTPSTRCALPARRYACFRVRRRNRLCSSEDVSSGKGPKFRIPLAPQCFASSASREKGMPNRGVPPGFCDVLTRSERVRLHRQDSRVNRRSRPVSRLPFAQSGTGDGMTDRILAWLSAGILAAGVSAATIAGAAMAAADDDAGANATTSSQSTASAENETKSDVRQARRQPRSRRQGDRRIRHRRRARRTLRR